MENEKESEKMETNSQLIKQVLEFCEAYNMPQEVKAIVKNKCWKLTRNEKENEYDEGNTEI